MSHRLVVLISGSGSNLQAIIDAINEQQLDASIELVLSNKADAYGLVRAQQAGLPTAVLSHKDFDSRESFDRAMIDIIDQAQPDTIALAGFMRILSPVFADHYQGKLLNLHPSLLPKHKGLNTHQRALDEGDKQHGCSIHFVTAELDGGPIVAQASFDILPNRDADDLAAQVHRLEHQLYPLVLAWRANNRLALINNKVELDGKCLPSQGYQLTLG